MALINLTVGGSAFSLDENNIVRVYEVSSIVMVDYLDTESKYKKTITVAESLATITAASTILIEVTELLSGGSVLINSNLIISVVSNGSGATISYDVNGAVNTLEVTESKSAVEALIPSFIIESIGDIIELNKTLSQAEVRTLNTANGGLGVELLPPLTGSKMYKIIGSPILIWNITGGVIISSAMFIGYENLTIISYADFLDSLILPIDYVQILSNSTIVGGGAITLNDGIYVGSNIEQTLFEGTITIKIDYKIVEI